MTVIIEVPGKPVPKARANVVRIGNKTMAFTPEQTRSYEAEIRHFAHQAMEGRPLINGALAMVIQVFLPVPPSWSDKKRQECLDQKIFPAVRPDLDNIEKSVLDACQCVVYPNDSQVVVKHAMKLYSEKPLLRIKVFTMKEYLEIAV
jgi:Holliday junction resolvase RusA-like endonuclease